MKSQFTKEYQVVIDILVKARQEKKLTQQVIADRLGKPQSFVSKYESCERRIDICEFLAIARALEESPFNLLRKIGITD